MSKRHKTLEKTRRREVFFFFHSYFTNKKTDFYVLGIKPWKKIGEELFFFSYSYFTNKKTDFKTKILGCKGRMGFLNQDKFDHDKGQNSEGRPNCARQSLASTLSAPRVAATSYCDPGRHANVVTPCVLTPCFFKRAQSKWHDSLGHRLRPGTRNRSVRFSTSG